MNSIVLKWATHLKVYLLRCVSHYTLCLLAKISMRFSSRFCLCERCSLICCVCLCTFLLFALNSSDLLQSISQLFTVWFLHRPKLVLYVSYLCVHCKRKQTCTKKTSNDARMVKWFISTRLQHAGFVIDLFFSLSYFIVYRATNG